MARPTSTSTPTPTPIHPYPIQENPEQLSNTSNSRQFNNNSISTSQNHVTPPALRIITKNKELKLYRFIQQGENQYGNLKNNSDEDSSSIVEPSSYSVSEDSSSIVEPSSYSVSEDSSSIVEPSSSSDEEKYYALFQPTTEPILTSRPSAVQKKNLAAPYEAPLINSFRHMPEDVIRKILFEHLIDLKDIPTTAKNLMHFASISKFNREFIRELLSEEGLHEVSFEITKSAIPDLLARLAENKKAKFTEADINDFVYHWPYLTFDCSLQKNTTFTNRGLELLKKIVSHPGLKAIRIINNLPKECINPSKDFRVCNNNGLEIIYALLSRKNTEPLKVDFIFNNWVPPLNSRGQLKDKSLDLKNKIQARENNCESFGFGELDLSRSTTAYYAKAIYSRDLISPQQWEYRLNFSKMMCNIALFYSAHTISLKGLSFFDKQLALILNEIQQSDKSTLQHLDLRGNSIENYAIKSLSKWLQSDTVCIKTLNLKSTRMLEDKIDILYGALKNNHSLESVEIDNIFMPLDHPIREYSRVKIT